MTDLESPRKNNDCYFYYYSTCAKGDNCTFRHEPSALGCETMCSFWKEGKCLNVHCNFRHMELRKNRKAIPCYWESQPGGCLKPHCPFMHQNKPDELDSSDSKTEKSNSELLNEKLSSENFKNAAVDSLVVNFEEESDNESLPFNSPNKALRVVKVKTLEEIKLEKIQAESAAYYSYSGNKVDLNAETDLRHRLLQRTNKNSENTSIQSRKRASETNLASSTNEQLEKPQKIQKTADTDDVQKIKIKTLAEIRAEKRKMEKSNSEERASSPNSISNTEVKKKKIEEVEVSSTSPDDLEVKVPLRKLKLRRKLKDSDEGAVSNSTETTDTNKAEKSEQADNLKMKKQQSKVLDEVLLLEDDDFDEKNLSGKDEDDLLKEIDYLLDD